MDFQRFLPCPELTQLASQPPTCFPSLWQHVAKPAILLGLGEGWWQSSQREVISSMLEAAV